MAHRNGERLDSPTINQDVVHESEPEPEPEKPKKKAAKKAAVKEPESQPESEPEIKSEEGDEWAPLATATPPSPSSSNG
jgi:hypothetical protein